MKTNLHGVLCIITGCLIFAIILYTINKNYYEPFEWSKDVERDFIELQFTLNPQIIYDLNTIQKYAPAKDVKYLLEYGLWPWSTQTQDLYKKALDKNPFVRTYSKDGLNHARSIYNESAILYILKGQQEAETKSRQVKPRHPLPSGWGSFGYNSGLIK
jgi:hypothetical protein